MNPTTSYSRQRIVHNTFLLYGRMLFTMWLNLWATRLTLQNLGVDDLGVYGVVGSVVSMFGVFSAGITTAVQRFITYELGRGKEGNVKGVFSTSLTLLLVLSAVLIVLLEVGGLWLLNHRINIPQASVSAAHWVFQFTVLAFLFEVVAIPYNALVIAYERMSAFAAISILKVVLTCVAAWALSLFDGGRLIVYGASMAAIAILVRVAYQIYCHRNFEEARYHFGMDRQLLGQMAKFAGVSTLSGVFQMLSGEGLMLVINWTFGVALNAVYGIALQLKNMVLSFALNLFKAIQPQITKTYAEGEMSAHRRLVYSGSKLEVYLIYFLMLPFLFRTGQILKLWLGEVPPFAEAFCQGTIFISLTYAAFEPIRTAVLATGRIARFMLIPEALYLLVLPASWLVAHFTQRPEWMLATIVGADILVCLVRIYLGGKVSAFRINEVLRRVVCPSVIVALCDSFFCYLLSQFLPTDLWGLLAVLLINSFLLLFIIVGIGLNFDERQQAFAALRRLRDRRRQDIA